MKVQERTPSGRRILSVVGRSDRDLWQQSNELPERGADDQTQFGQDIGRCGFAVLPGTDAGRRGWALRVLTLARCGRGC